MIPARGPQTRVGAIIDDADDGAGDGDGDDDDDSNDGDDKQDYCNVLFSRPRGTGTLLQAPHAVQPAL